MPIALDPKATFEYVVEDDRSLPKEEQTTFTLRGLTVSEEARVADTMISSIPGQEELAFRSGTHQLTVLRQGLRGWSNFMSPDGEEISFEKSKSHPKVITDDCLDRLSSAHRQELVSAILDRGAVTEAEGK
jgi:hypothetical protein|tara:strand:- start:23101 stop:23493 length:393 start_codon:yes stop_codon:yes gene_type:complete